jgi:hypothetical protein
MGTARRGSRWEDARTTNLAGSRGVNVTRFHPLDDQLPPRQRNGSNALLVSSRMVGNPSVTRPNGQRQVRCGLPVSRNFLPWEQLWAILGVIISVCFQSPVAYHQHRSSKIHEA